MYKSFGRNPFGILLTKKLHNTTLKLGHIMFLDKVHGGDGGLQGYVFLKFRPNVGINLFSASFSWEHIRYCTRYQARDKKDKVHNFRPIEHQK